MNTTKQKLTVVKGYEIGHSICQGTFNKIRNLVGIRWQTYMCVQLFYSRFTCPHTKKTYFLKCMCSRVIYPNVSVNIFYLNYSETLTRSHGICKVKLEVEYVMNTSSNHSLRPLLIVKYVCERDCCHCLGFFVVVKRLLSQNAHGYFVSKNKITHTTTGLQ